MSEASLGSIPSSGKALRDYWANAPFPLAFERSWECHILAQQSFVRPVLDVGCGEGLFASILFREPVDTGIDPNARELERARQLGRYEELIQCMGDHIPKPDCSYQTIFANSVLEHIPDLNAVLQELYRLLAPGGCLYATVPSDRFDSYSVLNQILELLRLRSLSKRYRAFFNRFWHHYHYYEPADWQRIFQNHGFEVKECYTYGPRAYCLLNDFLVPFSLPHMMLKKLLNRWTMFPGLRRLLLVPMAELLQVVSEEATHVPDGGLVFLKLSKGQAAAEMTRKSA